MALLQPTKRLSRVQPSYIYFFTDGNFQVEVEVNTCLLQIIELEEV